MLADEVNSDVGLLQATLHHCHQFAGDEWQRLLGNDRVAQFDQLAPQLVTLRFEVGSRGRQEDGFRVCGSLDVGVGGVAKVLENLRDIVGDVVYPFMKALQRGASEGLIEYSNATRVRVA